MTTSGEPPGEYRGHAVALTPAGREVFFWQNDTGDIYWWDETGQSWVNTEYVYKRWNTMSALVG